MQEKCRRVAKVERKTRETDICLELGLDGKGRIDIGSGIGFFDHMLELFAAHGFFDLLLRATGDIDVDYHHTVEDVGICLGDAFSQALCGNEGIKRYGQATVPMDEALCEVVVDICNRPFLYHNLTVQDRIGMFDVQLVPEFLHALANHAGITVHVNLMHGRNTHHVVEAVFKALGRALDEATTIDQRVKGVISTKGIL